MRSSLKRNFFAAFVLLIFTFSLPVQAGDVELRDDNLSKLKKNGIKQLVVPYFKVNVHTKLQKTSKASGGLFGGGAKAKASMWVEWSDPDTKMLQRVANDAWKTFEQQLTAAGFEVIPPAKVTATEAFKKINGGNDPLVSDNMLSLAPVGLKVYDPGAKIDPNGSFFLGVANLNAKLEGDIAREVLGKLEGVAVLRVTLNLAPGDFDTDGGGHHDGSASASVGFVPVFALPHTSPTVMPEITGVELFSNFESGKLPNGTEFSNARDITRVQLNALVRGEGKVSQLEEVTTGGEKAAAASVALIGKLMGQAASAEAGKYVAKVDGKAFTVESKKEIGRLAGLIGQKIATQ